MSSKRKEPESSQAKQPKQTKKLRSDVEPAGIELGRTKTPDSVAAGLPVGKGKAIATEVEPTGGASPETVKLKEFLSEVTKAFSRSSFDHPVPPNSNRAKFHLSFNRVILVRSYKVNFPSLAINVRRPDLFSLFLFLLSVTYRGCTPSSTRYPT